MNYSKRLALAMGNHIKRNLNFWTTKLGSESKARIHLRNASIDSIIQQLDYEQSPILYNQRIIEVRAFTEELAQHHGVELNAVYARYRSKHSDYDHIVATLKAKLRSIAVQDKISQMGTNDYLGPYGWFANVQALACAG